jgi:hypothetical protein
MERIGKGDGLGQLWLFVTLLAGAAVNESHRDQLL